MRIRRLNQILFLVLFGLLAAFGFLSAQQAQPDTEKIVGIWKIEVTAGVDYYYLTMEITETSGALQGTLSESMGTFTDLPVSEISFDGANLAFQFTCPIPPDGVERLVKAEFQVGEDAMEGYMSVPELEVIALSSASREKA